MPAKKKEPETCCPKCGRMTLVKETLVVMSERQCYDCALAAWDRAAREDAARC